MQGALSIKVCRTSGFPQVTKVSRQGVEKGGHLRVSPPWNHVSVFEINLIQITVRKGNCSWILGHTPLPKALPSVKSTPPHTIPIHPSNALNLLPLLFGFESFFKNELIHF